MAEWLKALVLKTSIHIIMYRGFESYYIRENTHDRYKIFVLIKVYLLYNKYNIFSFNKNKGKSIWFFKKKL